MVSAGVCNTRRKNGANIIPTTVSTIPDIIQKATAVPVAFCMDSSSFAPKSWAITTVEPPESATKKPMSRLVILAALPPTAASAIVPTNLPTTMASAAL